MFLFFIETSTQADKILSYIAGIYIAGTFLPLFARGGSGTYEHNVHCEAT